MNYNTLVKQIESLNLAKMEAQAKLDVLPGLVFIRSAVAKASFFDNEKQLVNLLIQEINERDEPMSFFHIKQIFEASGWKHTDKDVFLCNPEF